MEIYPDKEGGKGLSHTPVEPEHHTRRATGSREEDAIRSVLHRHGYLGSDIPLRSHARMGREAAAG